MGSSPVAFEYIFFVLFFYFLVSLSLFLSLCTTGYMYLNLACVYVTNTAPCIISISLHVINSLHAEYSLRLLLSSADFYSKLTFSKILTGTLSECQMVCIQIRTTFCWYWTGSKLFANVIS